MANILQVTQPAVPNDHRNTLESQAVKGQAENRQIQNPVDLSRVVRTDGREDGRTGTATEQGSPAIIDYESNYGAFIQRLNNSPGLEGLLEQLFFEDKAGYLLPDQGVMGALLEQMRAGFRMESPQQLLEYLMNQVSGQTKFSGAFFQNLRNILFQDVSGNLQNNILAFLKGYNDYSAGTHLLEQMHSMTDVITGLMFTQYRDEFTDLLQQMDWNAANGDTEKNTAFLNGTLIPFLSSYISRTHDFGAVRDALMLFILQAVKYENGSEATLEQLLERLTGSKEFMNLYEGDVRADLDAALRYMEQKNEEGSFADTLARLLEGGSRGEAGLENVQQFYNAFQSFLLNESVYMPILHFLLPFTWQGTDVMSEVWVDPDAGNGQEEGGRKIRMMFKFHIQQLGYFDMTLEFQGRKADLQVYVPSSLYHKEEEIQEQLGSILRQNAITPNRLTVREKKVELKVTEVFPEIREKEKSINVRV